MEHLKKHLKLIVVAVIVFIIVAAMVFVRITLEIGVDYIPPELISEKPIIVIPANFKARDGTIAPDEAALRIKGLPGYEEEQILEIVALVDEANELQYWSLKTKRGYVTVRAEK